MKNISLLLIAFSMSSMLMAQKPLTASQQAVQQTVIQMFDALSNRDSVRLKLYCTDDITLYEYGQVWNLDTLITRAIRLNTETTFKRINTLDFINTTISRDAAWATYYNQAAITLKGQQRTVKWLETVVLLKEEKRWKIKVLHSTLIK